MTGGRLPLQPLLDLSGLTRTGLAHHMHRSKARVDELAEGGMRYWEADEWSAALGFWHPVDVWGDLWIDLVPEPEVCKNGHERTDENTYLDPAGTRVCRECARAQRVRARARREGVAA